MHPMLRLVGFFVGVVILLNVLQAVPVIGRFFHGFFAFWIVAIGLSVALSHWSRVALQSRRLNAQIRDLGNVESPHNQGKLGALLLATGKAARALPHLENAAGGEPDTTEWHYRLGAALLKVGRARDAVDSLQRASQMDEEYGYGAVQLLLSEALLADDRTEEALACVDTFDRNHGPNPESAYRRGAALKQAGQRAEAAAAFGQVSALARTSARFQRKANQKWVWRAFLARLG